MCLNDSMFQTRVLRWSPLSLVAALSVSCAWSAIEIHVSIDGDDGYAGSAQQPVSTLHRAQQLIRDQRAKGNKPIEVCIHPGVYELSKPLVLAPEDSGSQEAAITWRAADPKDKPVLSGGRVLGGNWKQSDKPGIWQLDVPAVKLSAEGGGWNFRQLFVDGQRATRARFPNKSEKNPFLYATGGDYDHAIIDPKLIKKEWLKEEDLQINLVVHWLFFNQWNTIASIDVEKGRLTFTESERHGKVYKNNWFYVEGALVDLDEPGEWYLDRNEGRLYYMSEEGKNPNDLRFVAPQLDRIMHVKGDVNAGTHVKHLHFVGLDFRHTAYTLGHIAPRVHTDAAVLFENVQDSTVENCHFENIGGYAFWMHLDCQRNLFDRNTVLNSGGGGVLMTGSRLSYMDDSKIYTPGEVAAKVAPIFNRITRNTVKHCGKIRYYGGGVHLDSRPAEMAMLPGNYIAHNYFTDLSRNGIFVFRNQGGNVVEYNHIHDAMQTTIDGACIHFATMNHLNAPNYILNNWLYDIWGYRYLPGQEPKRVLANGVFLDWDTSNTTVRDNYVFNSGGEAIKAVWHNQNISTDGNTTSKERVVPPFVDQVGPEGTASNGIDLEANRLIGAVVHHSEGMLVRREGKWTERRVGGLGKLFNYNLIVAEAKTSASITYSLPIEDSGEYDVSLLYKPDAKNGSKVPIEVSHANGVTKFTWDMTKGHKHGFSVVVGTYHFEVGKPASVTLSAKDANGLVAADSVAFVKAGAAGKSAE